MHSRIMALDVGDRTVGVALSDPERRIASPLTTLRRTNLATDLGEIRKLVENHEVGEIVVGMPRSLSGGYHFQAERTQEFVDVLREQVSVPVRTWDERFSTAEADRALTAAGVKRSRKNQVIDQAAAAVILEGYLAYLAHHDPDTNP